MSAADVTNKTQEAEREWEERTLKPSLKRMPESREAFTTTSLVPVERLYTPASLPDFDYETELGFPANHHTPAAYTQPVTGGNCGRCGNSQGSGPPLTRTSVSNTCWLKARPGCRLPLIFRR